MHAQMTILRDIIYGAVPYGADVQRVCTALGIDALDLNDSERLVPFKPAAEVWDVVLAETGHDLLGLHLGEKLSPSILGMIGYLMQSSSNLYQAILQLAKFNDLHSTLMKYIIAESSDRIEIQYHPAAVWQHQYPESVCQSMDLAMSGLLTLFKIASAKTVFPQKVEVMHASRYVGEYERIFRSAVLFNSGRYALTFSKTDLLQSITSFDKSLFTRFNEILEKKLNSLNAKENFSDQVRRIILTEFQGNSPSVESVAAHLNMTVRSVQRKLKEEQTTYREIAARFKKELADIVLTDPRFSVSEVSTLLGYSDTSALRKALKRWSRE